MLFIALVPNRRSGVCRTYSKFHHHEHNGDTTDTMKESFLIKRSAR